MGVGDEMQGKGVYGGFLEKKNRDMGGWCKVWRGFSVREIREKDWCDRGRCKGDQG